MSNPFTELFDPFAYRARLYKMTGRGPIVDGDTQQFQLDQGFHDCTAETIRLVGVDTHEVSFVSHDSEEYERGLAEKRWVEQWFAEGQRNFDGTWPFIVSCEEYDPRGDYERVLATVIRQSDGEELNAAILDEFDDVVYET